MNKQPDRSERIQAYLSGGLSPAESKAFEAEMQQDPELREDLRLQEEVLWLLQHEQRQQQGKQVARIFEEEFPGKPSKRSFAWWQVAAIILLLVLPLALILSLGGGQQEPFQRYFTPLEDRFTQMGVEMGQETFATAMNAYNREEYPDAIANFQQISATDSLFEYALLYTANAQLAQDRAGEALATLKKIPAGDGFPAKARDWYQALAFLALQQPDSTLLYLDRILDAPGPAFQKGRARQLQEELRP